MMKPSCNFCLDFEPQPGASLSFPVEILGSLKQLIQSAEQGCQVCRLFSDGAEIFRDRFRDDTWREVKIQIRRTYTDQVQLRLRSDELGRSNLVLTVLTLEFFCLEGGPIHPATRIPFYSFYLLRDHWF